MGIRVRVAVSMQHHFAAKAPHRIDFDLGSGRRHHDDSPCAQFVRAECNTLRMVASRRTNHTLGQLFSAELGHLVISAAQFEAAHWLLVLAFKQHGVVQPLAQLFGRL